MSEMHRFFWIVFVSVACFSAACSLPHKAAQEAPFPHERHRFVACGYCHLADQKGQIRRTPNPVNCTNVCHREVAPFRPALIAALTLRHRAPVVNRHLIFSHTRHIDRFKADEQKQNLKKEDHERCKTCHGDVLNRASRAIPPMSACLSCHEHKKDYDEMRCNRCHQDLRRHPIEPLSDYTHSIAFRRHHKKYADGRIDFCTTCHDQNFCARCHDPKQPIKASLRFPEQVTMVDIHRGDFISRHGQLARQQPTRCVRCHGPSGCVQCHKQARFLTARSGSRSPHPVGYVRRGSTEFHGRDARRDPSKCQACHDQGPKSNCVDCHRVGGIGGNPHPSSWKSRSFKGTRFDPNRNAMCRYCHLSSVP